MKWLEVGHRRKSCIDTADSGCVQRVFLFSLKKKYIEVYGENTVHKEGLGWVKLNHAGLGCGTE